MIETPVDLANGQLRYAVRKPMIGLAPKPANRPVVTVPEGSILDLIGPSEEDPNFVVVALEGERVEVFERDLVTRCSPSK